jgi:hypothetical protein
MYLSKKTLEKLRVLINEETEYRSGPKIIEFFNTLGFRDVYSWGGGFPSRWIFTDDKLSQLNGKPELDQCIRNLFNPINFVEDINKLDGHIAEFNKYLAFDGWKVIRNGKEISFTRSDKIEALTKNVESKNEISEDGFLGQEFKSIPTSKIGLEPTLLPIIEERIIEIEKCMKAKASLSSVIICGSTLEGILLGIALLHPEQFNRSSVAPKEKDGKVKTFQNWTLANLIDVSYDIGIIKEDIKKFSHSLRDFRNFIHPYEQMVGRFSPDEHTSMICFQVLKAAIFQLAAIQ